MAGRPVQWTTGVDVTALTGLAVTGPMAAWTTGITEHLAGVSPDGDLIEFRWSPAGAQWAGVDQSQLTGIRMAGPVSAWSSGELELLAGQSAGGDLVVWSRPAASPRWVVSNLAADAGVDTGVDTMGSATGWRSGSYERVAGFSATGDVMVWSQAVGGGPWRARNVSALTGIRLQGPLAAWVTTSAGWTVDHLAGRDGAGDLLVFWTSPNASGWHVVNASAEAGGVRLSGAVTPWVSKSGDFTVEHLAGAGIAGDLMVFWWSPRAGHWQVVNATRIAGGPQVEGQPAAFQPASGGEALVSRTPTDRIVTYWWSRTLDWQAGDLADVADREMSVDPVSWRGPGASDDHHAGCDRSGHLVVLTDHGDERALVDGLQQPFLGIKPMRSVRRKVISILWDAHRANDAPRASREEVEQAVERMRAYYFENSRGAFAVDNVATLGWYDADWPAAEYWPADKTVGRDSTAEAIRKAAQEVDLAAFDTVGDGKLTPDELLVLHILPGWRTDGGGLGRVVGADFTSTKDGIVVDGVRIREIAEIAIGPTPGPGIVAHEFAHPVLGLGDMYWDAGRNPYAASQYSLMDAHGRSGHIDPAHRLKLAWLRPRVAIRSGPYVLPNVEQTGVVLVLLDPARSLTEYLLVENRWPGTSFDEHLQHAGLAVWHVVEDAESYVLPPLRVSSADWLDPDGNDESGPIGWSRQGVRMVRPLQSLPVGNTLPLWDGGDPATGYNLLSMDAHPHHAQLRWADGTPTGFAIRDISPAGAVMEFRLEVPGRAERDPPFANWMPSITHLLQRS